MEKEVLSVAVKVIQRKKGKKLQVFLFSGRAVSSAERNYAACEREPFEMIIALKKLTTYQQSQTPFYFFMHRQTLQYTFKKKYVYDRFARRLVYSRI